MIVRYKRPDNKNALSLLEAARKRIAFTLTLKIDENSSSTIAQNIHESFRMLGDAILISRGIDPKTHIDSITELTQLKINTKRSINVIDNIRTLRRNVNYYGYIPSKSEAEDVISIAKDLFNPLCDEIEKMIN